MDHLLSKDMTADRTFGTGPAPRPAVLRDREATSAPSPIPTAPRWLPTGVPSPLARSTQNAATGPVARPPRPEKIGAEVVNRTAGPLGPGTASRPPVLLSDNPVVCHTTKCGSGTISSPRTWTLRGRAIVTGGGSRVARRPGRRHRTSHPRRSRRRAFRGRAATPDRRGQVPKGTGGMPRRHQDSGR